MDHPTDRPTRVKKKDRTGVWISIGAHIAVIVIALIILARTKLGQELLQKVIQGTREQKKAEDKPKPPPAQPRSTGPRKVAADAPPPSSGRRATDAPAAVGEGLVAEERTETKGRSGGGREGGTNVQQRVAAPSPPKIVLKPSAFSAPKTDIRQLLVERAKASALVESFGTEQISKSGASDVSDIVGRISGASLAEGKFAVVRGLADRYTLTTLNGADIPSADPNRRAVQLDLFPAQFISKVDVSKTFQPDMPGGFAGGALNIVTRSFPEKPLLSLSYGASYNTQASLRDDFLVSDHGSHDWAALDDGKRGLPTDAAATNPRGDVHNLPIKDSFKSRQVTPVAGDSLLNQNTAVAFGDTTYLFGRRFGILGGFNYKQEYSFYDDGKVAKYDNRGLSSWTKSDARAIIEYAWGGMTTLAYELAPDHQIGFNFVYVQTAEDEARRLRGRDSGLTRPDNQPDLSYVDQSILHWTERNLTYYQVQGKHEFPDLLGLKMDWVGSLASTSQDEPDQRIFQVFADYENDPDNPSFYADGPSQPSKPARIFRTLNEDNVNFRTDWTLPVPSYNSEENSLKGGFSTSKSEQSLFARTFHIITSNPNSHPFTTSGDPASFLARSNNAYITYDNFPANFEYVGEQTISAWYGMGTWSATEQLRLVGGVRLESTDLSVDTHNVSQGDQSGAFSSAGIKQNDLLPAVSATFQIRSNLQLRAAWSQTVVRPTYREISDAQIFDVALGRTIKGNTNLTMSAIENYDVRLEWFPRPGELISVGGFMKKIDGPIELAAERNDNSIIAYNNFEKADVFGFEIELRKDFRGFLGPGTDQFSLGFNYAYIKSLVDLTAAQRLNRSRNFGDTTVDRPLYDQPEYVINGDLTWDNFLSGTSITLNGGVTGRRLVLVGLATPDEYEEPAPYLDLSISQKLGRRLKAKLSAKNLLNPSYEVTATWPEAGTVPVKSYKKGMSFGLSLSYDF
jgi:TonB-dependent receptor